MKKMHFSLIALLLGLIMLLTLTSCGGDDDQVIPEKWQGVYLSATAQNLWRVELSGDGRLSWRGFDIPDGHKYGATIAQGHNFVGPGITGEWAYIVFSDVNRGVILNHTPDSNGLQWIVAMGSESVSRVVFTMANMGVNLFPVPTVSEGFPFENQWFGIRSR
jgi:hypothetical protein